MFQVPGSKFQVRFAKAFSFLLPLPDPFSYSLLSHFLFPFRNYAVMQLCKLQDFCIMQDFRDLHNCISASSILLTPWENTILPSPFLPFSLFLSYGLIFSLSNCLIFFLKSHQNISIDLRIDQI